jgi:hypothetical protein
VVQAARVRGEPEAVRLLQTVGDLSHRAVEVDHQQRAEHRLPGARRVVDQRSRVDTPLRGGGEVVEACEWSGQVDLGEHDRLLPTLPGAVAPGDDVPTISMECEAADAPAMGDDLLGLTRRRVTPDPPCGRVAEQKVPRGGVEHRALGQPET